MATALNITVWIRYMGWTLGSPSDIYYAITAFSVLLLIVSDLQCRYRSYVVSIVFLWTLFGVYIVHTAIEQRVAVIIFALVTVINMIISFRKHR